MKILVLDIGNSKTKCYVFEVDNPYGLPIPKEVNLLDESYQDTNRGHPWDMADDIRVMLNTAIAENGTPDYGIITAFGDAFVHYDPANNGRPRFVFADEFAPLPSESLYHQAGFPEGNIEITGVRALRLKHLADWKDILPVNVAMGRELGGNACWWHWDLTQASATGAYHQTIREWLDNNSLSVCQSHSEIGIFKNMPLLAGGMDNAFLDTSEQTPYIVAGTWLVVSTIHDTFEPTETRRKHGIRWFISANGRYLAQTVRRSARPLTDEWVHQVFSDFQAMGIGGESYQKIRVFGAYSKDLCRKLNEIAPANHFSFDFQNYGEQHKCVAQYVYVKKGG